MQNDFIELIESPPKFKTKKCKAIAFLIRLFLEYTNFITPLIAWYFSNLFYAAATALVTFLVMGIIHSKMRNSSVPPSQREFHYNDKGVAHWYTGVWLCSQEELER